MFGQISFEELLDLYVPQPDRTNYLVNIGAQNGKSHDPTYPLLTS